MTHTPHGSRPRSRRPASRSARRDPLPWVAGFGVVALGIALTPPLGAQPDVLSDLDCIVEPSLVVDLGAAVPGLLAEARHERGDWVGAGTVMARLESDVEAATLRIAEERAGDDSAVALRALTSAFGERTRTRNDALEDAVSAQTRDQVRTEADIARLQVLQETRALELAELEALRARALLAQREIVSPVEGSVVARLADAGEFVDGEPVYRVARLDPLHVEVIVPIDWLDTLGAGMVASVTLQAPGYENRALPATVSLVDSVADAASATYGVRLTLDNPDLTIPSGVRCRVDFPAS